MSFKGRQPILNEKEIEVLKEDLIHRWEEGQPAKLIAKELEFGEYPYHKLTVGHIYYYRKLWGLERRKRGIPAGKPRYKVQPKDVVPLRVDQVYGKLNIEYPLGDSDFINLMNLEWRSFIWLVYYGILRASELYERKLKDFVVMDDYLKINLARKKKIKKYNKEYKLIPPTIQPYYYPRVFPHMDDEAIYYLVEMTRKKQTVDAPAFPHVTKFTSWNNTKRVLGTYPHYSRFSGITAMASDNRYTLRDMILLTGLDVVTLQKYIFGREEETLQAVDKGLNRFEEKKEEEKN